MIKLRSNPAILRKLADKVRRQHPDVARALESAAIDIDIMIEDIEFEREATRAMAEEIATLKPPKVLS